MDKSKKTLSKSRAWIYILLATVTPFVLFWITFYLTFDLSPRSSSEYSLDILLVLATISSPVLAPYLAYRYFKAQDSQRLAGLGKVSGKEITKLQQTRKANRNKQLVAIGIALILTVVGIISRPIIRDIKYQLEYGWQMRSYWNAREKGCRELQDFNIQQSSDENFGHYSIIKGLAYTEERDNLRNFSLRLSNSFEQCKNGEIKPVDQNTIEIEYVTYLESTAHKILDENPTGLSEAEISNIREIEARNHQ